MCSICKKWALTFELKHIMMILVYRTMLSGSRYQVARFILIIGLSVCPSVRPSSLQLAIGLSVSLSSSVSGWSVNLIPSVHLFAHLSESLVYIEVYYLLTGDCSCLVLVTFFCGMVVTRVVTKWFGCDCDCAKVLCFSFIYFSIVYCVKCAVSVWGQLL